jgi:hypothetical protein
MSEEIFKDILGYEGLYQVSNFGNVKSLSREMDNGKRKCISKERILKFGNDGTRGYLNVKLFKGNTKKTIKVHQLVAMAFLGHISDGSHKIVVDHINNIKTDNRAENLQLLTNRENSSKDKKNGSSQYTGVYWCNYYNKWHSRIYLNGKKKHLGYFTSEIEAHEAYQKALSEIKKIYE